jgi:hypothetical protein
MLLIKPCAMAMMWSMVCLQAVALLEQGLIALEAQ